MNSGSQPKGEIAEWLKELLKAVFFVLCDHEEEECSKNEKNLYCMECRVSFCKNCSKHHGQHRCIQICRYVYQDVVRFQDIQKYFDISKIQTYKINGEKAVHLNPRPRDKDARPSTKAKFASACAVCGRYLQDIPNCYCSIACKLKLEPCSPATKESHEDVSLLKENSRDQTRNINHDDEDYEFAAEEFKKKPLKESNGHCRKVVLREANRNCNTPRTMERRFKRKGVPRRAASP